VHVDHLLSQLNQLLGQQRYAPAVPVLLQFVSKPAKPNGQEARAAAIWALGWIYEGKAPPDLSTALQTRLNDVPPAIPPEDDRVRLMCAITLGRMKAKDAVTSLQVHFRDKQLSREPVNNAAGWALEQITGKVMPRPRTIPRLTLDWFLRPTGPNTVGPDLDLPPPPSPGIHH
jgi:HEAT repeat protein